MKLEFNETHLLELMKDFYTLTGMQSGTAADDLPLPCRIDRGGCTFN